MNIVPAPVQQLPDAQSVTNDDFILVFKESDGKAHKALASLFHGGHPHLFVDDDGYIAADYGEEANDGD